MQREQRERQSEAKRENERTASLVLPNNGQILQNILLTIFTKIPGSGQICVGNSQRTPCAFNCDGFELKIDFLVSTSGKSRYLRSVRLEEPKSRNERGTWRNSES